MAGKKAKAAPEGEGGLRTLPKRDAEGGVQRDGIPLDVGLRFGKSAFHQKGACPIGSFQLEPLISIQITLRQTQVVQDGGEVEKLAVVPQLVALADRVGK